MSQYPFKAKPGDILRLEVRIPRTDGYKYDLGPMWLHHVDSDYNMKLCDGLSGTYYGEYDQANKLIFNQTYTIPSI